jgi:lactate dehydrogenase-like 2-hydroxyacid dehydrogenase
MTRHRVLIIDPQFATAPDIERTVLPEAGYDISIWRPAGDEAVPHALLGSADAILNCRSRHGLKGEAVAAMAGVKIVVQAGVGFNHIDLAACAARGIPVCNTPDYGTMEVADHAIALMLSMIRGVTAYNNRLLVRDDAWATLTLPLAPVRRLRGLTFGVVGLGRIGTAAALRARAFGMNVAFHDPHLPPGAELSFGFGRAKTLHELMAASDVISVHCPLTPETARLIDTAALAAAKPGAVLVNTARGGVVDLDAVEAALRNGRLVGAALDVLPVEPLDRSHPLLAAWTRREPWLEGRLIVTPHAAFYTPESLADMRRLSAQAIRDYFEDGTLRSCVNRDALAAAAGGARRA